MTRAIVPILVGTTGRQVDVCRTSAQIAARRNRSHAGLPDALRRYRRCCMIKVAQSSVVKISDRVFDVTEEAGVQQLLETGRNFTFGSATEHTDMPRHLEDKFQLLRCRPLSDADFQSSATSPAKGVAQ